MSVKNGATIFFSQLVTEQLGLIWIAASANGLVEIGFDDTAEAFCQRIKHRLNLDHSPTLVEQSSSQPIHPAIKVLEETKRQLLVYLDGDLAEFKLPLDWTGMPAFQEQVLRATIDVPAGQTMTYQQLAKEIGNPSAARAVGRAEATNPMPLVIPCHRIVGSDGSLRGYGGRGGINTKAWLLKLEKGKHE